MSAPGDGGCVFLSGESTWKETDKETGETRQGPHPTRFRCWIDGWGSGRFRAELDPEVVPWVNGAAPFHSATVTRASDGKTFASEIRFPDPETRPGRPGQVTVDPYAVFEERTKPVGEVEPFSVGTYFFPFLMRLADGRSLAEAVAAGAPRREEEGFVHDVHSVTLNEKIRIVLDPDTGDVTAMKAVASDLAGRPVMTRQWGFGAYVGLGTLRFPRRIRFRMERVRETVDRAFVYQEARIDREAGEAPFSLELPPRFVVFDNRSDTRFTVGDTPGSIAGEIRPQRH